MVRIAVAFSLALLISAHAFAAAEGRGSYYVTADQTNEHLGPSAATSVTNTIYRQQRVDVFEVRGGWARVSDYYDGGVEGVSGQVARWVPAEHLDRARPADLAQPDLGNDPRIQGLPKVGENGLTEEDVRILHRGARYFLESGQCKRVELGDKSLSRQNTYYINCGEPRNRFFTPADLPRS